MILCHSEHVYSELLQHVRDRRIDGAVGTTACVAIFAEYKYAQKRELFIANLGDSAAVMCRGGRAKMLTTSHNLKNPVEKVLHRILFV
jgi:serine/threonine protein phosphatase PrpC